MQGYNFIHMYVIGVIYLTRYWKSVLSHMLETWMNTPMIFYIYIVKCPLRISFNFYTFFLYSNLDAIINIVGNPSLTLKGLSLIFIQIRFVLSTTVSPQLQNMFLHYSQLIYHHFTRQSNTRTPNTCARQQMRWLD